MMSTVLLVDDEPDLLSSLGRILKVRGLTVDTAGSGEEAVEMARGMIPDAILMDMRMPGMNGLEACRQIKSFQKDAIVVLMTGYSEMLDEATAEGIEVLSKPVDPGRVCELVGHSS